MVKELAIVNELIDTQIKSASSFVGNYPDILNNSNYISLRTIEKRVGTAHTKQAMLYVFGTTFQGGTGTDGLDINPDHVAMVCDSILENYPDVSLDDITLFAKKVLRGEFIGKEVNVQYDEKGRKIAGQVIKQFKYDVPTLCLMFQRYYSERLEAFEEKRQRESNEQKITDSEIHPDILQLFADAVSDADSHKGIYKSLQHYCETNGMQEISFTDAYAKLYDHVANIAPTVEEEINLEEFTEDDIEKIFETQETFIAHKIAQFLVVQNQIQTSANPNKLFLLNKIVEHCGNYDVEKLVELCKDLGMWMIPTKYYYAAKKLLLEGGEIKFRYDLNASMVAVLKVFVEKLFADQKQSTTNVLFVTAMIFNFALNINRFNKYNGERKTDTDEND